MATDLAGLGRGLGLEKENWAGEKSRLTLNEFYLGKWKWA